MQASHGHALYRIRCDAGSFVLKLFGGAPNTEGAPEVCNYRLLAALGVPTLPLHGSTNRALLLEDLRSSPVWRLAREEDSSRVEVARALAAWYRTLHDAGHALLTRSSGVPEHLQRETDTLSAEVVWWIGQRLGMEDQPVWSAAAEAVEPLKAAMRALPETLNYNDMHWTNLSLSRGAGPLRAIVFDYHLLGLGPACSDIRNVCGSLQGAAREAFRAAYGPVDARAEALDAPLATLYSLQVALLRPRLPAWAKDGVRQAADGTLLTQVRRARALC